MEGRYDPIGATDKESGRRMWFVSRERTTDDKGGRIPVSPLLLVRHRISDLILISGRQS